TPIFGGRRTRRTLSAPASWGSACWAAVLPIECATPLRARRPPVPTAPQLSGARWAHHGSLPRTDRGAALPDAGCPARKKTRGQWREFHRLRGSCCGAMGIRTPDLFHAMEARYQLRHSPLGHHPPYPLSRSGRYILLPPRGNGTAFSLGSKAGNPDGPGSLSSLIGPGLCPTPSRNRFPILVSGAPHFLPPPWSELCSRRHSSLHPVRPAYGAHPGDSAEAAPVVPGGALWYDRPLLHRLRTMHHGPHRCW